LLMFLDPETARLASGLLRNALKDKSPEGPSDAEVDAKVRDTMNSAAVVVSSILGPDQGANFSEDLPRVKAAKLMKATLQVVQQRSWPTPFLLAWSDMQGGTPGMYMVQNYYRSSEHPDVRNWVSMTERQRGEVIRRMHVEIFQSGVKLAEGTLPLSEFIAKAGDIGGSEQQLIREAFGTNMADQYQKAIAAHDQNVKAGYRSNDILEAAIVFRAAAMYIVLVSM